MQHAVHAAATADVRLTRESGRRVRLHGPCALLRSNRITLNFRGVPVLASSVPYAEAPFDKASGTCSYVLPQLAGHLLLDGCESRPRQSTMPLLQLAVAAMPASAFAPTPAFNLDDHFQLLHAISVAAQAAPEPSVHNVEVGSFAGHSVLLQAAALNALGLNRSTVHSVEPSLTHGMNRTMSLVAVEATLRSSLTPITWHPRTVANMSEWRRPLRLFFEDSHHTPDVTHQSFQRFESRVVEGGVVVLHDVSCCAREYRANQNYLERRVFSRAAEGRTFPWLPRTPMAVPIQDAPYREIWTRTPEWSELETERPSAYQTLREGMIRSVDLRTPERQWMLKSERHKPADCVKLCASLRNFASKLQQGYQWSTCTNTRAFMRTVRQHPALNLTFGDALTIDPCAGPWARRER